MRLSRCHEGERSFALSDTRRAILEPVNRAILDARYPAFTFHTRHYYQTPEAIAEQLLASLLPDQHGRLIFALDFSSFRAAHNGTFKAGPQLLQAAGVWQQRFNLHVICSQEVYDFHGYANFGVPRSDPHAGRIFAAIFRVGWPYDWNVIQRLTVSAPVIRGAARGAPCPPQAVGAAGLLRDPRLIRKSSKGNVVLF
jgi:hypothetical protein